MPCDHLASPVRARILLCGAALSFLCAAKANAYIMTPTDLTATIKKVFEPLVDRSGRSPDKAPGLVIGFVTESGSGVVGLGTTRLSNGSTPDGNTLFAIGSISKIFTGFILAKAVLDGKIDIDESINTYLKDDLNVDPSITPARLVSHTSGLPNLPDNITQFRDLDNDGVNDSTPANPGQNYTREQLAACLKSACGASTGPGARAKYSNLGFGILGIALEDRLGFRSFDRMTNAYIATPLNMTNTGVKSLTSRAKVNTTSAVGYDFTSGRLRPVPFPDMGALASAGGLISTADDMLRLLRGLTGIRSTPLKEVFLKAMTPLHSKGNTEIAYGIKIVHSRSGARIYGKDGSTTGYTSLILWMREPQIGLILLTNRGHFKRLNQAGLKLINTATSTSRVDARDPSSSFGGD
jgi:CubicO group peptidase (beta-lactamase class C family)